MRPQVDIPDLHGRIGAGRPCVLLELPGDDAHFPGVIRQWHYRDFITADALIGRGGHLVRGGQVHPQLDHFQLSALVGEGGGVKLLVEDASTGGHPLHVTRPNHAALSGGIPVSHLALVDDGHCFKAAMWVLTNAARLGGRGEACRPCVIQQQEGAQLFAVAFVGKQGANREAVSHPVRGGCGIHTENLFHGGFLRFGYG